jgi:hypothetical protein
MEKTKKQAYLYILPCSKCGQYKEGSFFYTRTYPSGKVGFSSSCKQCKKLCRKEWKVKNPSKVNSYRKEYYRKNRERIRANARCIRNQNPEIGRRYARQYRATHAEQYRTTHVMHARKATRELLDRYVRRSLSVQMGIKNPQFISKQMIELQREIILMKRLKKEVLNGR